MKTLYDERLWASSELGRDRAVQARHQTADPDASGLAHASGSNERSVAEQNLLKSRAISAD
ncbi:hypothetical protein [Rhizobium sp. J15]|uniref:hypothetical protein n=1 Tax=Rhizobium sp. J15 TaxID=2035450 RepID=UPI001141B0CB|nr:hypothetical protein [Rhizobium sp. J15]